MGQVNCRPPKVVARQQHYYWPVPFDLSLLGDIHLFFLVVNQDRAMRSAYYLGCLIQI